MGRVIWPGRNVTVPLVGWKSTPGSAAAPADWMAVTYSTAMLVAEGAESATVNSNGVTPAPLPSGASMLLLAMNGPSSLTMRPTARQSPIEALAEPKRLTRKVTSHASGSVSPLTSAVTCSDVSSGSNVNGPDAPT